MCSVCMVWLTGLPVSNKGANCRKILSKKARALITAATAPRDHRAEGEVEEVCPAYMPPSADPEDYSKVCSFVMLPRLSTDSPKWCSVCEDFGDVMVLCSHCRVSICVKTLDTISGCVAWESRIEDPDFVYVCPWCARKSQERSPVCPTQP